MIPSAEECSQILNRYRVPEHIVEHSRRVGEIASCLGRLLNRRGAALDPEKIFAASMLHDIAKMDGLRLGEDHSTAGAELLRSQGYPEIAEIVRQHVVLDEKTYAGEIGEAALVHYADKRVKHTALVSLEERFLDLKERYGKHPAVRQWLEDLEGKTKNLEERIFNRLQAPPDSLQALMKGD
jgi:uncharacterized protein